MVSSVDSESLRKWKFDQHYHETYQNGPGIRDNILTGILLFKSIKLFKRMISSCTHTLCAWLTMLVFPLRHICIFTYRVQHRFQNIIFWGGQATVALKLTCTAGSSTCLATLLNEGEVGLRPKYYLPSGASHGLVQLGPLLFFAKFTCNGASGFMLHADTALGGSTF